MKNISYYCLLPIASCIILFLGCEKTAHNVDVPGGKPKIVVSAFISPQDDTIRVLLTNSVPLLGIAQYLDYEVITNATVTISHGSQSVVLPYDATTENYLVPAADMFPITGGEEYTLNVSAAGFDAVSASCEVPLLPVPAMDVKMDSSTVDLLRISVGWNDFAGTKDYYRVIVLDIDTTQPGNHNVTTFPADDKTGLVTDEKGDASALSINFHNWWGHYDTDVIDVYLMRLDYNYYRYQSSVYTYHYNDPFSEPSILYSNVENGLGVFAAYNLLYVRYH